MDDQRIGRTRAPELRPLYCYKTVAHHPTQTARDDHQSIMNAVIAHTEKMDGRLNPPSSKNYTTRHLLVAALAEGESTIHYPATSEDSTAMVECLRKFGARIDEAFDDSGGRHLTIAGFGRRPQNPGIVDTGNAGAVLRFLMGLGALVGGEVRYSTEFEHSLGQRPHGDLLSALEQLGVQTESRDGKLPIVIRGGNLGADGVVRVSGSTSSQFLSSLLFLAPLIDDGVEIEVVDGLVSKPLVSTTIEVMEKAGIRVETADDMMSFRVAGGQSYQPGEHSVNGDYPSAAAILAAAAVTDSHIAVDRLFEDRQGERAVIEVLRAMGVAVDYDGSTLEVKGHSGLRGLEFDGDKATDMVLAMLPVAAHAHGETRIFGIANLRKKECDRIAVPVRELRRLGVDCEAGEGEIVIRGRPSGYEGGIEVDTHSDHRVAQMLTLMGMRCRDGLTVRNADTVAKSYPAFFDDLISLGANIRKDDTA